MWPAIIGAAIGGLASYLGGKKAAKSAEWQQLVNIQEQEKFAKEGIRWKVEDAKAAGLHPLFALQGSGATFSPNPIVTTEQEAFSGMGQNLSRAAQAAMTRGERDELKDAQVALAQQQTSESYSREVLNFAQASAVSSKAALDQQGQFTDFPGPGPFSHFPEGQAKPSQSDNTVIPGQFKGVPHEIISPDRNVPGKLAGPAEARYKEAEFGKDARLLMPHQGGQFQEDMTLVDVPSWIAANVQRYGWNRFLGTWLVARDKLVREQSWDRPVVDLIEWFISRNSNVRR